MGETGGEFAENEYDITLREFIRKHADHLDVNLHALMAQCDRIERHLQALTADVAEVKPLLDRWRNSKVAGLIGGTMPWQK